SFLRMVFLIMTISFSLVIFGQNPQQKPAQEPKDNDVIKTDVMMVNITATVADTDNRFVSGLRKENFEIYEDKQRQEIALFSDTDSPITLGILIDISGSMGEQKFEKAKKALKLFLETCNYSDEIFMIVFSGKPVLLQDFTTNERDKIQSLIDKLTYVQPHGQTALYDSVYIGINKVQQGKYKEKMALLIISDGQDNNSRYSFGDIKKALSESNIIIYSIGVPPTNYDPSNLDDARGQTVLKDI